MRSQNVIENVVAETCIKLLIATTFLRVFFYDNVSLIQHSLVNSYLFYIRRYFGN